MKRYRYIPVLPLLLSGLLICLSCAKQEPDSEPVSGDGVPDAAGRVPVRTISTFIDDPAPADGSKTDILAGGKVVWSEGDKIAVFAQGTAYEFELTAGAGGENAVFTCYDDAIAGKVLDGVAIYPWQSGLTYNASTRDVQVCLPHKQSAGVSSAPMFGSLSGNHYHFHNLGGVFQFTYRNVPPEAHTIRFTAATDVSGLFTIKTSARLTAGMTATPVSSGDTRSVSIILPTVRTETDITVQVPVPAGSYSGYTLALYDWDDNLVEGTSRSGSKSLTASVSHLSPVSPITLPAGVRIEWYWDNGGDLDYFSGNVPAIDADGNVYVVTSGYSNGSTQDKPYLYKLDKNGALLWSFSLAGLAGRNNGSPCLEADGSAVYVLGGTDTPVLYAVTSSGSQKWKLTWPSAILSAPHVNKAFVAVGRGDYLYVPVNQASNDAGTGTATLLTVRKSDGAVIGYASAAADGSTLLGQPDGNATTTASGPVAISSAGAVAVQTYRGAFVLKQSLLDSPASVHTTNGKYVPYSYWDNFETTWNSNYLYAQDVICGKKGPTSQRKVFVSAVQEESSGTASRMNFWCSDATEALDCTLYRQQIVAANDADWHSHWRYQYPETNTAATAPGGQDQGGLILGHNDLEVIVPLKAREAGAGADDHSRPVGPAGLLAIWMNRDWAKAASTAPATSSWRYNINTAAGKTASTHSVEPSPEVSGAAAIDNNGWIHLASQDCYHIFQAESNGSYTITRKVRVPWKDLLRTAGLVSENINYANVWSSVKLGYSGRIYINLNVRPDGGNSYPKGAVLCLSYPGVTGPDPTSSWPMKGADPGNSCCQLSDASVWTVDSHEISW